MSYHYMRYENCKYCKNEESICVEEKFKNHEGYEINPYEYQGDEEDLYNYHTHNELYCYGCNETIIEEVLGI